MSAAVPAPGPPTRVRRPHGPGMPWPEARRLAGTAAAALPPVRVPLAAAARRVLAADVVALADLPVADVSAMDGWAVAGEPPWRLVAAVRAGAPTARALLSGECAEIATGAPVPPGTDGVLPVELSSQGQVGDLTVVSPTAPTWWTPMANVRRVGEEARTGELLVPAGAVATPAAVGVAAAAGHDTLLVHPPAAVDLLVLGDELATSGLPRPGRVRDALGPLVPAWLAGWHATCSEPVPVPDRLDDVVAAVGAAAADLVVTTGGTSVGPHDHVHGAVARLGGRLVVDGVHVKPGHPMLLAELPGGRWLAGLPGNPLAAAAALVTLVGPLLDALHGRPARAAEQRRIDVDQPARDGDGHRLLPARSDGRCGNVLPSCGAAMLRGLARADGMLVVPPQGARAGAVLEYLSLP